MQIRCSTCTKTIAIAPTGALPPNCPHCTEAAVPERLGAYVLDRLLATGGMGEVYLAHHDELGTEVAIKLLPALPLDAIDSVRERFAREARLTARIEHRGVVRVVSSDAHGDRPYLVLELVTGTTLRHVLQHGGVTTHDAARIVADTADVLAAAHRQGVLHRDIKPDNVMLQPDGAVRVLDFGIARAIADDTPLTRTGEIVGTPEYMAPEQLLDGPEATDERTDVHALGVLLYELLTNTSPFRGANLFQSLKLVESLRPKAPQTDPAELATIVMRALEKRPEDRFASATELAEALRVAVPDAAPPLATQRDSSRPLWLAAAGVLIGIAGIAFAWTRGTAAVPDKQETTAVIRIVDEEAPRPLAEIEAGFAQGHWSATLADAQVAAAAGEDAARPLARAAFVLTHAAWWRIADLPPWLAAYDLGLRERLFGDLLEPRDDAHATLRAMLQGDDAAWSDYAERARGNSETPRAYATARVLAIAARPARERADLLASFAQGVPIEQPEHWLARTIERHLRRDRPGAAQAAEMAWLTGAGDLALLLDAALSLPDLDRRQRQALWRRLSKCDRLDCPASTLLLLHLETTGVAGVEFEPAMAHSLPLPHRAAAGAWFVAEATRSSAERKTSLLCIAAALAVEPDFSTEPWSSVPAASRPRIEREARRAR